MRNGVVRVSNFHNIVQQKTGLKQNKVTKGTACEC